MKIKVLIIQVMISLFFITSVYSSVQYNGHTYLAVPEPMTWADANSYANSLGGHLATISDSGENDFVCNYVYSVIPHEANNDDQVWFGLIVGPGPSFVWVTGEPVDFFNWAGGEPNNYGGPDVFGVFGRWDSEPCLWNDHPERLLPSVIEFDYGVESTDKIFLQSGGSLNDTSINISEPVITVETGDSISGTIKIQVENGHGSSAVVPVIYTPTWGSHSTSYETVDSWANTGTSNYDVTIDLTAPDESGTYYIIFASAGQTNGSYVASFTQWTVGTPSWNDGNDLADYTESDMGNCLSTGSAEVSDLLSDGSHVQTTYGVTYIKINVINPSQTTTVPPTTTTTIIPTTTTTVTTGISVDFMGSPTFGFTPLTVNFTNLSSGDLSGYEWNFGDGSTSGAENPSHTYTTMGNFGVTLTAYGTDGNSKTETKPNYIFALPGCPFMSSLKNQKDINTLRTLRDSMLNNIFGLVATCIYYQNSAEVAFILSESPELQGKLKDLVSENISVAVDLINGRVASVQEDNVDEVIDFLNEFKAKGSPKLKVDINLVIEAIRGGYFLYGLGVKVE